MLETIQAVVSNVVSRTFNISIDSHGVHSHHLVKDQVKGGSKRQDKEALSEGGGSEGGRV